MENSRDISVGDLIYGSDAYYGQVTRVGGSVVEFTTVGLMPTGPKGDQGIQGPKGDTGPQGPQGIPGEVEIKDLPGANLAMPDLSTATDLGNGIYKLTTITGVDIHYNVYNGVFTFNGVSTRNSFQSFLSFEPLNGIHSLSVYYVSGEVSKKFRFYFIEPSFGYTTLSMGQDTFDKGLMFSGQTNLIFNPDTNEQIIFDNFQFKLQLEKGDTATPYTVPGQIPQYKIVGEE